jgi:hypothetical protein
LVFAGSSAARARRTVTARARPAGGLRPASAGAAVRTHSDGAQGLPPAGALRLRGWLPSRPPSTQAEPSRPAPAGQARSSGGAFQLVQQGQARSTVCGSKADGMARDNQARTHRRSRTAEAMPRLSSQPRHMTNARSGARYNAWTDGGIGRLEIRTTFSDDVAILVLQRHFVMWS